MLATIRCRPMFPVDLEIRLAVAPRAEFETVRARKPKSEADDLIPQFGAAAR
jgi:hypothetical protein